MPDSCEPGALLLGSSIVSTLSAFVHVELAAVEDEIRASEAELPGLRAGEGQDEVGDSEAGLCHR
jgi:hypothetical protein